MASKNDCGNEDTPQTSVNLMNIIREYPTKYTYSKVLDHKEPVPTVYRTYSATSRARL